MTKHRNFSVVGSVHNMASPINFTKINENGEVDIDDKFLPKTCPVQRERMRQFYLQFLRNDENGDSSDSDGDADDSESLTPELEDVNAVTVAGAKGAGDGEGEAKESQEKELASNDEEDEADDGKRNESETVESINLITVAGETGADDRESGRSNEGEEKGRVSDEEDAGVCTLSPESDDVDVRGENEVTDALRLEKEEGDKKTDKMSTESREGGDAELKACSVRIQRLNTLP